MGTISRKLGVDELPPSSEAADLIEDHEHRGRTGNYILISVISCGARALQGRRHWGAGGAMAPPVFSYLYSKSRNLLSQLYKWPPQIFCSMAPPDFWTCLRP